MAIYTEKKFTDQVELVRWRAVLMDQARQAKDVTAYNAALEDFERSKLDLALLITFGLDLTPPAVEKELEPVEPEPEPEPRTQGHAEVAGTTPAIVGTLGSEGAVFVPARGTATMLPVVYAEGSAPAALEPGEEHAPRPLEQIGEPGDAKEHG